MPRNTTRKKWVLSSIEICLVCKNEYLRDVYNKKYCSSKCLGTSKRISRRSKDDYSIKLRQYNLKKLGLTINEYCELVKKQNNLCAICTNYTDKLVVDHDHDTGAVRGLLCGNCNSGIGMLKDSLENISKALDYLKVHKENKECPQLNKQ